MHRKILTQPWGGLYDLLLERMVAIKKFTVVDWEEIDRVLKLYVAESQPNISDEDAKKQAVNQLCIEKMYVGTLRKVGSKYYVSVKVLNLDLTVSRVVRIPECNWTVGMGVTIVNFGRFMTRDNKEEIITFLSNIGVVYEVGEEQFRAIANLMSCGPALWAKLIDLFVEANVKKYGIDDKLGFEVS